MQFYEEDSHYTKTIDFLQQQSDAICKKYRLGKSPNIALSDDPRPSASYNLLFIRFSIGIIDLLNRDELVEILRHELAHHKHSRRDFFLKWVAPLAAGVLGKKVVMDSMVDATDDAPKTTATKYAASTAIAGGSTYYYASKFIEKSADTNQIRELGGDPDVFASAFRKLKNWAIQNGERDGAFPYAPTEKRIEHVKRVAEQRDRKEKGDRSPE